MQFNVVKTNFSSFFVFCDKTLIIKSRLTLFKILFIFIKYNFIVKLNIYILIY